VDIRRLTVSGPHAVVSSAARPGAIYVHKQDRSHHEATAASAFSKLGLKPEMVAKAVPVLTSFVSKSGGAGVGSLLAGVLK
jgi:hypothetical protein